jgi:hypothetical protein
MVAKMYVVSDLAFSLPALAGGLMSGSAPSRLRSAMGLDALSRLNAIVFELARGHRETEVKGAST